MDKSGKMKVTKRIVVVSLLILEERVDQTWKSVIDLEISELFNILRSRIVRSLRFEMEHGNKSIKLPTFSGEPKEAQIWLMRFQAYAGAFGFTESIEETPDVHLPKSENAVIDETTDAGKKQLKAKRSNRIALANLTMAFTTEALMGMIYKARTTDWPNGLAWMVMKQIHTKYFPKDLVSKIELRRALNGVSMKQEDDPALLFDIIFNLA
jgi:hypothetical protein